MSNYYCYICHTIINGNIFKAFDQNLCSTSCRECLIEKFNFTCNYKLEKKQINLIKKSTTSIKINDSNKSESKLHVKEKYQKTIIGNKDKDISEKKNNKIPHYKKDNRMNCINIYTSSFNDLIFLNTINNVIQRAKNFSIY